MAINNRSESVDQIQPQKAKSKGTSKKPATTTPNLIGEPTAPPTTDPTSSQALDDEDIDHIGTVTGSGFTF